MSKTKLVTMFFAWLVFLASRALCQCPEPTESELESLTLTAFRIISPEGSLVTSVELNDWNINCLAAASTRGYGEATVALNFTPSTGTTLGGQLFISCSSQTWGSPSIFVASSQIGRGVLTIEELLISETDTNCISCSPLFNSPIEKLPSYCTACSGNCSAGLMQCYLDANNQEVCCNFYNSDDNCVSECGINQVPSEDFVCTCVAFFQPPGICTECGIQCTNGDPESGCNFCVCDAGYEGILCDENINECLSVTCQNGGTCTDGINSFTCTCPPGFTGQECEIDIDECSSNPCRDRGECIDGINSFVCVCSQGFSGITCEADIDECAFNFCENNGTCIDGINTFSCNCSKGFTGETCQTNIDDCSPNPCQNGGSCFDEIDTFSCDCPPGFTGRLCDMSTDNCLLNFCQNNATCVDENNTYSCMCPLGFSGVLCQDNIDDCSPNPCKNNAVCLDGISSFECQCLAGFTGATCETDIDDCASDPCLNGGICVDLTPGFYCDCPLSRSGTLCEMCSAGFVLESGVCVKDCVSLCVFTDGEDNFDQNLCRFYCQLSFWRDLAIESGLTVPELTSRNPDLPPEEQWNQAIEERDKFGTIWRAEAVGEGVQFTMSDTSFELVDSNTDRWKQLLESSLNEQLSWQAYIRENQPEIVLQTFDTIQQISQAIEIDGVSPVYGNLLSTWSLDSAQCS